MSDKAVTTSGWKRAKTHTIRVPSGVFIEIIIPDIPDMIESGQFPQNLVDAALSMASREKQKPTKEMITQQKEYTNILVQRMVVNPKLTAEDVLELPYEDKEMLVEIASRVRDLDAEGHHIGGLHTSKDFRTFRGLGSFDEDVEDLFES